MRISRSLGSAAAGLAAVAMLALGGSAAFGSGHGRYVVSAGDTVDGLAFRFGVTPAALVAANDLLNPNVIFIGQKLIIPGVTDSAPAAPAPAASAPAASAPAPAAQPFVAISGPLTPLVAPAPGPPDFPAGLLHHSSRLALRPEMQAAAAAAGIPAGLLEATAWMESGWQTRVVSSTGAVGVLQIEPETATWISTDLLGLPTTLDARNAADNIRMSAAYLAWLLHQTNGNVADALGGYYQGLASLWVDGPMTSTRQYVQIIGELWSEFRSG